MPHAIFRKQTPEEAELAHRRLELTALRAVLAGRESDLAHLRSQLVSFEGRYLRQVGRLLKHLDDWEERIAEQRVRHNLTQPSNSTPEAGSSKLEAETPTPTPEAEAPLRLRSLFRDLAKRIHPDFALDPADERRRTRLMALANDAYLRADLNVLQRMWHGSAEIDHSLAADLAHVLLQTQHVQQDIAASAAEFSSMSHSDLAQLQQRTLQAALAGRDLLAEMASRIKGSIGLAMRQYELDLTRIKRPPATTDVDSLLTAATPTTRRFATRR